MIFVIKSIINLSAVSNEVFFTFARPWAKAMIDIYVAFVSFADTITCKFSYHAPIQQLILLFQSSI